ncbi:MAG: hypothetical protein VX026_12745, partial [Myxococcota bacterium]|nr:hypothetical protein [Myxococcota bacterium]
HVNGQQLNLGAGSQVNGNQILTDADPLSIDWSDISNRPAGLDNGDDNTQRSETEVENFITNGSIDLNVSTTIGGETILTTSTDSDTLAALGCADGQVVKFNLSSGQWACATDIDTDTNLSQTEVVNHVNGQQLNLGAGSQVNNRNIVSQPTTCSDGQYLTFNASTTDWVCSSDAYSSLASLSDVSITTASNNNILRHDGTSWINSPQSSIVNLGNINQQNTVFEETNSSTSIGPSLVLKRRSTAGLSEYLGRIHFKGDVSTSSNTANQSYAQIYGYIEDPDVSSPDGRLVFETHEGSSSVERMRLDSNGVTLADTLDLAGNTLTGTNFDLSNNDLVDIGAVTSSEWDQVQNIGTNNIGNAEWGHVASLDQDLSTTDNPTFGDLTVDTLTVNNAAIDADTLAIGTDDYYAPLLPERDDQYNGEYNQTDNLFTNTSSNDFAVYFRVTLPAKKGNYNLVIKDVLLDIDDADANNYIRYVSIKGMTIQAGVRTTIKN